MDEKLYEDTLRQPQRDRPIDSPLVEINLPKFIKQIREE